MYSAASPEIDDPLGHIRRADAERHVLGVSRASGVIVAADAANAAGNKMRVTRIFPFHEDAVAAEDGRSAVAFGNFPVIEIDLGKDSKAAHDPRNRIPIHLDKIA